MTVHENVEVGLRFGRHVEAVGPTKKAEEFLDMVGIARSCPAAGISALRRRFEAAGIGARPGRASTLLLCDEIRSGLTETESGLILRLLCDIRRTGTTILYVEHNLRAIMSVCDPVIVMNYGQN